VTFNADEWVTSREPSLCGGGACVEVFWAGRAVNVRDTKLDPLLSPVLRFEVRQWRELLAAIVQNVTHPAVSVGDDGTVRLGVEHLHGDEPSPSGSGDVHRAGVVGLRPGRAGRLVRALST
jgi:hypothetical protein